MQEQTKRDPINYVLLIVTVTPLFIIVSVGFLIYVTLKNERVPTYFRLDNPNATYKILKSGNNYLFSYNDGRDDVVVMVGNSKVDLAPYVGSPVRIKGKLNHPAEKQCIAQRCHPIPNSFVVDIDQVTEWNASGGERLR